MKVSGSALLSAPVEAVRAALGDSDVLARTVPGCQRVEAVGPGALAVVVNAGVASIRGTWSGTLVLTGRDDAGSYTVTANAAGAHGTVAASIRVGLEEDAGGTTRLHYDADAAVDGSLAAIGSRMLAAAAQRTAAEFLAAVNDALTAVPAPQLAPPPPEMPAPLRAPAPVRAPAPLRPPAGVSPRPDRFLRGVVVGAVLGAIATIGASAAGARRGRRR